MAQTSNSPERSSRNTPNRQITKRYDSMGLRASSKASLRSYISSGSSIDLGRKRTERSRGRPAIQVKHEIKEAEEKEEIQTPSGPNFSRFKDINKSPNGSNKSSPERPRSPVHVYDTYTVEDNDLFKSPQGQQFKQIRFERRSHNMSPFQAYGGGSAHLSTTRFRQSNTNVISAERR